MSCCCLAVPFPMCCFLGCCCVALFLPGFFLGRCVLPFQMGLFFCCCDMVFPTGLLEEPVCIHGRVVSHVLSFCNAGAPTPPHTPPSPLGPNTAWSCQEHCMLATVCRRFGNMMRSLSCWGWYGLDSGPSKQGQNCLPSKQGQNVSLQNRVRIVSLRNRVRTVSLLSATGS